MAELRPPSSAADWLEATGSPGLVDWLTTQNLSLAFTSYQTGKLFLVGRTSEGQLHIYERSFDRCMGLWAGEGTLWLATRYQIWRFVNLLRPGEIYHGCDRLYVPMTGHTTSDLDVHDLAIEGTGRLVFVATKFGCLATLSRSASFTPLWRPPFLSRLVAEDRCHLNGLALVDGRVRYASLVAPCDVVDGWRDRRRDGGQVLEVPSGRVLVSGLSMPHSPRVHAGQLWVLNSGTGFLGSVPLDGGTFEPLTFCPGYLRGLAITGHYAVVGLSRARRDRTFGGLQLEQELISRGVEPWCGLQIIDLRDGQVAHWLRLEGLVTELYDVVALSGAHCPMALGFKTDDIARILAVGAEGTL
jgi:uncharacterized protein (TIGR03032 family)